MSKLSALKIGDTIGLIAPAGAPNSLEEVNTYIKILNDYGFKVKCGKSIYSKEGYLAGSDDIRSKDIMDMFTDSNVKAIFCYKGGYGTGRLLPYLDFKLIESNPKIFVGFSDITVLLNVFYEKCHFPTIQGQMGLVLRRANKKVNDEFMNVVTLGYVSPLKNEERELKILNEGIAEGVLVGGNLSLIYALMGTPYQINMEDKILFIEDVDEAPYSIDRMLLSLKLSGDLNKLKGIICGYFTRSDSNGMQTVEDVLNTYFGNLSIPVVYNFESGHELPFRNLPIGLKVKIDTFKKEIEVKESLF